MRFLHGHFVKLGVLGNLGVMELELLHKFNATQQLFEIIVCPISLGVSSPLVSKEVFNKALHLIGESPSSCIVASGHDDYLKFATSLGMIPVKYEGMDSLSRTLDQLIAKDTPSYNGPVK